MRTARLRTVHPVLWAGWAALAAGAVLCVIGWYGVSGERFAERQLPYLASCTVPGAALIVAGAVLLTHGRSTLATARVEELYGLLVAAEPADAQSPAGGRAPVAVSGDLLMVPGRHALAPRRLPAGRREGGGGPGRRQAPGERRAGPLPDLRARRGHDRLMTRGLPDLRPHARRARGRQRGRAHRHRPDRHLPRDRGPQLRARRDRHGVRVRAAAVRVEWDWPLRPGAAVTRC